jgi:hypothetical protein
MNPLPVVDEHDVVELITDIAAQRPDYVHRRDPKAGDCLYLDADGSAPACIVWHTFARLGATVDFLHDWEEMRGATVADDIFWARFTPRALGILRRTQWRQDEGRTWGAVAAAAAADLEALETIAGGAA